MHSPKRRIQLSWEAHAAVVLEDLLVSCRSVCRMILYVVCFDPFSRVSFCCGIVCIISPGGVRPPGCKNTSANLRCGLIRSLLTSLARL